MIISLLQPISLKNSEWHIMVRKQKYSSLRQRISMVKKQHSSAIRKLPYLDQKHQLLHQLLRDPLVESFLSQPTPRAIANSHLKFQRQVEEGGRGGEGRKKMGIDLKFNIRRSNGTQCIHTHIQLICNSVARTYSLFTVNLV